jgi:hypothetical protein
VAVSRLLRAAGGAALAALVLGGCSVMVKDPGYTPPPPLPPLEQLKQAPLTDDAAFTAAGDVLAFVTADRNIACALTSARGPHLDLPYEPNNFSDPGNRKLDTVPVAHCELAVYPEPKEAHITDTCSGTGLGYLGGSALLTPGKATYGQCRSGVTAMEAAYGPHRPGSRGTGHQDTGSQETSDGGIAELPVLADGGNLERNGLRCSAYDGGVACGNVSGGVAFFVSRDHYELISPDGKNADAAPSKTPKSP